MWQPSKYENVSKTPWRKKYLNTRKTISLQKEILKAKNKELCQFFFPLTEA